jgi:N-acetylmuramoyl-L-alanine amidase
MNKLIRFLAAGALACALLVCRTSAATVTVSGTSLPASAGTFLLNDRTYVPLRAVAQLMEPDVRINWNNGTATVTSSTLNLSATVGEKWIKANGRYFYVPDGVRLVNNSVMVHVRALASAMGGTVNWNASTGAVDVRSGSGSPGSRSYTDEELYWLSRIISAESRGESLEGKIAVGTVVLNRVASSQFPDTIYGVIFDRKWGVQFTPVANGTIYQEPTAESVIAAHLCLEGARVAGNSLYFLNPAQSTSFWIVYNRPYVTTIGSHSFYA